MSLPLATRILADVDPRVPWRNPEAFAEAIAAHTACFDHEVRRRSHQAGAPLRRLLANLTAANRSAWLFNNLHALQGIPVGARALAATGTTANEAFHARVNQVFRHAPETFSTTVDLQMSFLVFASQLAHVSAMKHPGLRQVRSSVMLARAASSLDIPKEDWIEWCRGAARGGSSLSRSYLRLARERLRLERIISASSIPLQRPVAPLKRPAGVIESRIGRSGHGPRKRTAFTLRRLGSLTPPVSRRRMLAHRMRCKTKAD
jgi:hypothetical protein